MLRQSNFLTTAYHFTHYHVITLGSWKFCVTAETRQAVNFIQMPPAPSSFISVFQGIHRCWTRRPEHELPFFDEIICHIFQFEWLRLWITGIEIFDVQLRFRWFFGFFRIALLSSSLVSFIKFSCKIWNRQQSCQRAHARCLLAIANAIVWSWIYGRLRSNTSNNHLTDQEKFFSCPIQLESLIAITLLNS